MGYNTNYEGELKFTHDITVREIRILESIFGEDIRGHTEWGDFLEGGGYWCWLNLELLPDFSGIIWDGSEKTNDLHEIINFVIRYMRKDFPNFGLEGEMKYQGEEIGDVGYLQFDNNGWLHDIPITLDGDIITCPHYEEQFVLENNKKEEK